MFLQVALAAAASGIGSCYNGASGCYGIATMGQQPSYHGSMALLPWVHSDATMDGHGDATDTLQTYL
jgi:hypothetical protein